MADFLTIDIEATGVRVSGGVQVVGLPPLTAIDGFVHAIEREFGVTVVGWSMAFRQCEQMCGHSQVVNYEFRHKAKKSKTPYIRDSRTATVKGFLVLYTDGSGDIPSTVEAMNSRIEAFRFCGGTLILGKQGVQPWGALEDAFTMMSFSYREPHFLMEDRTYLLGEKPDSLAPMDWLLDLTARPAYISGSQVYAHNLSWQGFLTPVIRGYSLLEPPRVRESLRDDYRHAYAEPIIGLVRMRSLSSVMLHLDEGSDERPEVFWFGSFQDDSFGEWSLNTFFVC